VRDREKIDVAVNQWRDRYWLFWRRGEFWAGGILDSLCSSATQKMTQAPLFQSSTCKSPRVAAAETNKVSSDFFNVNNNNARTRSTFDAIFPTAQQETEHILIQFKSQIQERIISHRNLNIIQKFGFAYRSTSWRLLFCIKLSLFLWPSRPKY